MRLTDIEYVVGILISNYKLQIAVVNKLAALLKIEVSQDMFKEYHHDLTKLNLPRDWFIGFMPGNNYYDRILKLDPINMVITNIPSSSGTFKQENNPKKIFNELLNKVDKCNKFLAELKNANV